MLKLLILLVIILGVIAVAQLARVYELTSNLRKNREEEISHADNRLNAVLWIVYMVVFYIGFIYLMSTCLFTGMCSSMGLGNKSSKPAVQPVRPCSMS